MLNLYQDSLSFNYKKIECGELLFVEYTCLPNLGNIYGLWSPYSHLVYVTSGSKSWITPTEEYSAFRGEAVYCKQGACLMKNVYDDEFCAILLFFPKSFIKEVVLEFQLRRKIIMTDIPEFHVLKLNMNDGLKLFFESVSNYLLETPFTSQDLIKLKFKEFVFQVLTTDLNPLLRNYFFNTLNEKVESIESVVRKNLFYNLSLNDYASLCNKSLSSFKREFKSSFGVPPLVWIQNERLKYAKSKLMNTDDSIGDIALTSGFESASYFIRCFKKVFGESPLKFRNKFK